MFSYLDKKRSGAIGRVFALGLVFVFLLTGIVGPIGGQAFAQTFIASLPAPTQVIGPTVSFQPPLLKGIRISPTDPFKFDFIIDEGKSKLPDAELKAISSKLINYFLASLTIPEKDLWVNLSPYEKDKIVPTELGQTDMGRDMLGEDYILKQLVASLTYPESTTGKEFWDKVYSRIYEILGTTKVPVNTFNKIWIMPDKAVVYENNDRAIVGEARLKVMLEEDYLALDKNLQNTALKLNTVSEDNAKDVNKVSSQIMKQKVLPIIEEEVNSGENFAYLRQIYYSLVLATWFKKRLKESVVAKVYADKKKLAGVEADDPDIKDKIYNQYLEAYKKGVYNYIKKETDPGTGKQLSRRYYSGGLGLTTVSSAVMMRPIALVAQLPSSPISSPVNVAVQLTTPRRPNTSVVTYTSVSSNLTKIEEDVASHLGGLSISRAEIQYAIKNIRMELWTHPYGFSDRDVSGPEQLVLLREDFRRFIAAKVKTGSPKITIYLLGLGREPNEALQLLEALGEEIKNKAGSVKQQGGWTIDLVAADIDQDSIDKAKAVLTTPFFLDDFKENLGVTLNPYFIRADILDRRSLAEGLSRVQKEAGVIFAKGDYVFARNLAHGNNMARKGYLGVRELKENLPNILGVYLSTRNAIEAFAHEGTRFVIESSGLGKKRRVLPIFDFPGLTLVPANNYRGPKQQAPANSLANLGSGIYEVRNPAEVEAATVGGFLNAVAATAPRSSPAEDFQVDDKVILTLNNERPSVGTYKGRVTHNGQELFLFEIAGGIKRSLSRGLLNDETLQPYSEKAWAAAQARDIAVREKVEANREEDSFWEQVITNEEAIREVRGRLSAESAKEFEDVLLNFPWDKIFNTRKNLSEWIENQSDTEMQVNLLLFKNIITLGQWLGVDSTKWLRDATHHTYADDNKEDLIRVLVSFEEEKAQLKVANRIAKLKKVVPMDKMNEALSRMDQEGLSERFLLELIAPDFKVMYYDKDLLEKINEDWFDRLLMLGDVIKFNDIYHELAIKHKEYDSALLLMETIAPLADMGQEELGRIFLQMRNEDGKIDKFKMFYFLLKQIVITDGMKRIIYHGTERDSLIKIVLGDKGGFIDAKRSPRAETYIEEGGLTYFSIEEKVSQSFANNDWVDEDSGLVLKIDWDKLSPEVQAGFKLGVEQGGYELVTLEAVPLTALTEDSKNEVVAYFESNGKMSKRARTLMMQRLGLSSPAVENRTEEDIKGGIDLDPTEMVLETKGAMAGSPALPDVAFDVEHFEGFTFRIISLERGPVFAGAALFP